MVILYKTPLFSALLLCIYHIYFYSSIFFFWISFTICVSMVLSSNPHSFTPIRRTFMKPFIAALFSILLMGLLLSGCSSSHPHDVSTLTPDPQDRLVIYTSHRDAVYEPIIREFEARTGIWVEVKTGGTMELLTRIAEGNSDCDLLFGGGTESLESHKEFFSPYISPLAGKIVSAYRSDTGHWTPFSFLPIVLAYNSKLVRLNPPSGWEDLLEPTWQGRIAFADPTVSASAYTALSTLLQIYSKEKAETTMHRFLENLGGEILPRSSSVIEQIAYGNCYIGVMLEDEVIRSIHDGYDVAMVFPKEGTSAVCDGLAVVAGCAHEANAQRFIDFVLTTDVQRYLVGQCYRRSVLDELSTGSSDTTFITYDSDWASHQQNDILALWNRLLQEVTP